jgi:hypothetical protein
MADLNAVKNNVRKMLAAEFGTVSEDESGDFFIRNESTVAYVSIDDWDHGGENVGRITIFALVANGVKELSKDLAVELVTELSRPFGTWVAVKRDDGLYNIIFKTDLIASTVDSAELINAVLMVAIVANDEDDKLVRKYGGTVFVD